MLQHKVYVLWKSIRYLIEYVGGLDKDFRSLDLDITSLYEVRKARDSSIFGFGSETISVHLQSCVTNTEVMERKPPFPIYSAIAKAKPLFELNDVVIEATITRHVSSPTPSRQRSRDTLPSVVHKPIDIPFDVDSILQCERGKCTPDKPSHSASVIEPSDPSLEKLGTALEAELSDNRDFSEEVEQIAMRRIVETHPRKTESLELNDRHFSKREIMTACGLSPIRSLRVEQKYRSRNPDVMIEEAAERRRVKTELIELRVSREKKESALKRITQLELVKLQNLQTRNHHTHFGSHHSRNTPSILPEFT